MILLGIKYLKIGGVKDHSKKQMKQANLRLGQQKKHDGVQKEEDIYIFLSKSYKRKPPGMVFGCLKRAENRATICVALLGQALLELLGLLSIAKGENYQIKSWKPKTMAFWMNYHK